MVILVRGNIERGERVAEEGYPQSLLDLYERNPEARQFVLDYENWSGSLAKVDLTKDVEAANGGIPLFLQWDERWGYERYGDDFLAITGCGPTCLSMVYVGLTGDTALHPYAMAQLAEKDGYYVWGSGSSWSMMTGLAEEIGLEAKELIFDEKHILDALWEGRPIICIMGAGDFTTTGHFIVLTGVTEEGEIVVHDPNSLTNSEKTWDLHTIMKQIRNLWVYDF
ncbi:MAG: C39 family peptidase [Lachnospiraceae bacterium]|nr:C39 family peptidase [Lachnospiraceae bacterium]